MLRLVLPLVAAAAISTASFAQAPMPPTFSTMTPDTAYASTVKGVNIYNQENKSIGEIEDIAFSSKGVDAYIVSVGGFLGIGEKYVAIQPSSVMLTWDPANKKWMAKMNATAEQLKSAPEFKYPK
ncbi:MAG: hypothetical protein BGP06_06270 [Rhizobiales bacterium 65-9]|nr:PRC-barrel domain-containing protein [Hyphomicrobiales bacterium]OJY35734.1 MAG: hypothetical protein BGP06_06270 [Rhizobiales bacterium 65-9]